MFSLPVIWTEQALGGGAVGASGDWGGILLGHWTDEAL